MKKIPAICSGVFMSLSLLVSLPAFGGSAVNVEDGKPAIVKVYGNPVGIESNYSSFSGNICKITYGVLPMNMGKVAIGGVLRIKVIGDKDIIVRCNGEKGITISRE